MNKKETAQHFIEWTKNLPTPPPIEVRPIHYDNFVVQYIIDLCEKNNVLYDEFVVCGMNSIRFYIICKSIVENWTKEQLSEKIDLAVKILNK